MEWIIGFLAVTVLAVGISWYVAAADRRPLTAEERTRLAPGNTVRISEGDIHYILRGPEDGQVIVLAHGFGVPHFVFEQASSGLAEAGYRVVLFDHFGRGWSDRPRASYEIDFFDRELAELITALKLKEPVVLLGYSMGGVIAAEFAARHADRVAALVLLAPAGLMIQPFLGKVFGKWLRIPLIGDWLWRLRGHALLLNDDVFREGAEPGRSLQGDDTVQMAYSGFYNALLQSWRNLPMRDRDAAFRDAAQSVPTLALFGDRDDTIPPESVDRMQKAAPNAEVEIIGGGSHVMVYEMHDVITQRIVDFLTRELA